ncbi:MAG TPA: T9SS type A sorting domain-containing protein [Candidatus Kapabacteria bacterium]
MKRSLNNLFLSVITLIFASNAFAQQSTSTILALKHRTSAIPQETGMTMTPPVHSSKSFFKELPQSITLPGSPLPVQGTWPQQSNSRALHNIQIDPSNPLNVHAVITALTNNTGSDVGSATRRIFYTFSGDGGQSWKAPVVLGTVRSGYADLQLYQRSPGVYVPVIAGHQLDPKDPSNVFCVLWVEKGAAGDGNFAQCEANNISATDNSETIIWPSIAISNDGKFVYMIASYSPPPSGSYDQLQFGIWNLSADTAIFQGWSAEPGSADQNNSTAGITTGGAYRIAVSKSGHIGVVWENTSESGGQVTDGSIYISESMDGGVTWSSTIPTVADGANFTDRTESDNQGRSYAWTPSGSFDFWYNGDHPECLYVGDFNDVSDNYYLPYTTTIYLVNSSTPGDVITSGDTIPIADVDPNDAYSVPNFLNLSSNVIDLQALPISWPTVALGSTPNQMAVFYQTYIEGDTQVYQDDTGTVIFPYGSIFYSYTLDGGQTWNGPVSYLANDPSASQKIDYRFPQTSYFNPNLFGNQIYTSLYAADTGAGFVDSVGQPGFDVVNYGLDTVMVAFDGVASIPTASNLALANFPNPVTAATNIQYSLLQPSHVTLTVTDMLGRPVATLVDGFVGAGEHQAVFSAGQLANGIYRYTLDADGVSVSKCLTVIR